MKIDTLAIMQLFRRGMPYAKIGVVAGCSKRQITRIVNDNSTPMCREANRYARRGDEKLFWMITISCGVHPVQVAQYSGVSRQAIYDAIREMIEGKDREASTAVINVIQAVEEKHGHTL